MMKQFFSPDKNHGIAIHYQKVNWRLFRLLDPYTIQTKFTGPQLTANHKGDVNRVIVLDADGKLTIPKRFEWNGPTDFPNFDYMMRGSCVHDALYEVFDTKHHHEKRLELKPMADKLLYDLIREDGASVPVASAVYWVVSNFSKVTEE